MKLEDPVCGLVSLRLVEQVSGGAKIESSHQKLSDPTNPKDFFYDCTIRNVDTHTTFVQLRVSSVVDKSVSLKHVADDRAQESGKIYDYSGNFGDGYGAETDESDPLHPSGLHVNVVRGDWQYDLVVYNWPEATPDQRRKLVEQMVADIEKSLTKKGSNESAPVLAPPSAETMSHLESRLG